MKFSKEIKKELHEYIDSIDDEETLWMLQEDVVEYIKKEKTEEQDDDYLTEEQQKQLDEAIRQADTGETMSLDEFKAKMSSWHSK